MLLRIIGYFTTVIASAGISAYGRYKGCRDICDQGYVATPKMVNDYKEKEMQNAKGIKRITKLLYYIPVVNILYSLTARFRLRKKFESDSNFRSMFRLMSDDEFYEYQRTKDEEKGTFVNNLANKKEEAKTKEAEAPKKASAPKTRFVYGSGFDKSRLYENSNVENLDGPKLIYK